MPEYPKTIDLFDFFEKLVDKWNEDDVLNTDWRFAGVLRDDAVNQYKRRPDDGIIVFLTNLSIMPTNSYQSGVLINRVERWGFNLRVVKCDEFSRNNYNEIPEHDIQSSRWRKILLPLKDFLLQERLLDFCRIYGIMPFRITGWTMTPIINWMDNNYSGWDIRVTLEYDV